MGGGDGEVGEDSEWDFGEYLSDWIFHERGWYGRRDQKARREDGGGEERDGRQGGIQKTKARGEKNEVRMPVI